MGIYEQRTDLAAEARDAKAFWNGNKAYLDALKGLIK